MQIQLGIIEEDIGFFIVKVEDKVEAKQLPFNLVKQKLAKDLKKRIEEDKRLKLLESLKSKAVIIQ